MGRECTGLSHLTELTEVPAGWFGSAHSMPPAKFKETFGNSRENGHTLGQSEMSRIYNCVECTYLK